METKEIVKVDVKDKPWDCNGKPMYNVAITFADGTKGHGNALSQQPPYGPGDFVEVQVTGKTPWGDDKVKVKKADGYAPAGGSQTHGGGSTVQFPTQSPSAGSQPPSNRDKDIQRGMDINNITRLVASGAD
jgi:hypothetical protein